MVYREEEMGCELPPGFRFHPTDEELIIYYLRNQVAARPCPVAIIPELNIYKFDPWQLPGKSELCEGECYFFSPRYRKYPNGARPNRATASGYWKATGTDKAIYSRSRYVGLKKALVFYQGRPPKGIKTDWIMHEYRVGGRCSESAKPNSNSAVDLLDEWVLCRIYQKKHPKRYAADCPAREASVTQVSSFGEEEAAMAMLPRPCSLTHLLDPEYWSTSLLFDDNPLGSIDDIFDSRSGVDNDDDVGMKHQGSQTGLYNSVNFGDLMYLH